jgi:hypothetical protein
MKPDLPQKAASDRRSSPQSASFFQWKGLLFLFVSLLLPSAALSLGLDPAQTEKLLHPALLELVPGPAPSVPSDEAASGIKNVKKPPAETKSPRELSDEAALRNRARRAADGYTLSNKTLFGHIMERHGPASAIPGKSRFLKGFDVRSGIDFVLKSADARIRSNTEGRSGYIFEVTYHKKIGISPEKKPLKTLRVVIDEAGRVITAFPVK